MSGLVEWLVATVCFLAGQLPISNKDNNNKNTNLKLSG